MGIRFGLHKRWRDRRHVVVNGRGHGMCDNTNACGCSGKPSAGADGLWKWPLAFLGLCFAIVAAIGILRALAPYLILAGSLFAAGYVTRTALRVRRRWLDRPGRRVIVPGEVPAGELTPQVRAAIANGQIPLPAETAMVIPARRKVRP
jgi:hypothetical protein